MTSHEFTHNQSTTLDQLKADPNLLLQEHVLTTALYEPQTFISSEAAEEGTTTEQQHESARLQAFALSEIIRPEQAARTAKELTARIVTELEPVSRRADTRLMDAANDSEFGFKAVATTVNAVKQAQIQTGILRELVANPAALQTDDWEISMRRLEQFASEYAPNRTKAQNYLEDATANARSVDTSLDELAEQSRRGATRIQNESNTDLYTAGPDSQAIIAVANRAEQSIADHKTSCDQDVQVQVSSLRGINAQAEEAYESARLLTVRLSAATEGINSTPVSSVLMDHIDALRPRIRQVVAQGTETSRAALDQLTILEDVFRKLDRELADVATYQPKVLDLANQTQHHVKDIRASFATIN